MKFTHVPFKGGSEAIASVIRGDTAFTFASVASFGQHVKGGALRDLAGATARRSKLVPDIPAIAELRIPDYNFALTGGWVVRPGTPESIAAKLRPIDIG